jgi:hypothetical protein
MTSTAARLARLRADIAAGTYAPEADAVAESLVGWIAHPDQFERAARHADDERYTDADDRSHRQETR